MDEPILVFFPQFSGANSKSSMAIYARQIQDGLAAQGRSTILVTPESYLHILGYSAQNRLKVNQFKIARKLGGWLGEYILLQLFMWYKRDARMKVFISQEYAPSLPLVSSVVIVHDLIQLEYPRSRAAKLYYRFLVKWPLKRTYNISISKTIKGVLQRYDIQSDVIYNIFEGASNDNANELQEKVIDVLWVGTNASHKVPELFLTAARYLDRFSFTAIVPPDQVAFFKQRTGDNVDVLSGVSDLQMLNLFASTKVFLSTSLTEGYGRPAMEARLAGARLLLSSIDVYHELHGCAAEYFDPDNSQVMIEKLLEMIQSGVFVAPVENHKFPISSSKELAEKIILFLEHQGEPGNSSIKGGGAKGAGS